MYYLGNSIENTTWTFEPGAWWKRDFGSSFPNAPIPGGGMANTITDTTYLFRNDNTPVSGTAYIKTTVNSNSPSYTLEFDLVYYARNGSKYVTTNDFFYITQNSSDEKAGTYFYMPHYTKKHIVYNIIPDANNTSYLTIGINMDTSQSNCIRYTHIKNPNIYLTDNSETPTDTGQRIEQLQIDMTSHNSNILTLSNQYNDVIESLGDINVSVNESVANSFVSTLSSLKFL